MVLRWYGLMIALGFLAALQCAIRLARRLDLDVDCLVNLALICFIAGVIGARIYYVALSIDSYIANPLAALEIWKGGLSIHGGIIGGIIAGVAFLKREKKPVLPYADIIAATIPLAQAIGRWGNFFNSEAFGRPVQADFPLKLAIAPQYRPASYQAESYFHPTFLYESIWNLALFAILYRLSSSNLKKKPGVIFCLYLIGYSLGRVLIEPLRVDTVRYFMAVPVPVLVSAITVGAALALMLHFIYGREPKA